jgi:hypothetical protein
MATTTNFNWETPDDTDLVKDGAAAIRTLGSSIDTSFVDLKGGTTGQVLSKASNTDLDFTWTADAQGIPATIFDAKGDLIAATAADTASRLAVGTNGQVLTADSTASTGIKWASPSASTTSFTQLATGSLSGSTVTVTGLSGYNKLFIYIKDVALNDNAYSYILRFNSDTASNYTQISERINTGTSFNMGGEMGTGGSIPLGQWRTGASGNGAVINIDAANSTGIKVWNATTIATASGSEIRPIIQGYYSGTSVISSINIVANSSNFQGGSYLILGAN